MKNIKKNLLILFVLSLNIIPCLSVASTNNKVQVSLPYSVWEEDLNIDSSVVNTTQTTILWYVKVINKYLWFAITWVSMAVLIYAWIQLITAWWDKSKVSKWWKLALSCIIAMAVAMLSYTLVNLIVNLF